MQSCSDNEPTPNNSAIYNVEKGVVMQLGKKLENPYSVKNIEKKALENLKKSKLGAAMATEDLKIITTHLYVKFIPKTEQEKDNLMIDSSLVLYDYPLDYEIQVTGDYYRDPLTPADQPTPQYCAVKVDDVYYAPTNRIGNSNSTNATMRKIIGKMVSAALIDALVEEALRITNNLSTSSTANITGKTMNNSWRPAGRIRVWDDFMQNFVGVEDAQVRARRWFTTHRGSVGADGFYSCDGTFKSEANYSIDWDRYDFALQDHWLNGATFNGPKREGNWDLNLRDDKQEYYATIFRAAHHYYYKDIKGLRRPPQNSFWKTKMKIKAFYESNSESNGSHLEERRFLGAQIKIYNSQNPTIEIYATTIHELAHASHWNMSGSDFDNSETKVKESWAAGVEWELTRVVYPNYSRGYNNRYTGVVVDMIDVVSGNDQVEGYTIRQIEDALNGEKSWINWRNNIKNRYNNATENNLDALFNTWDF